MTAVDEYLVDLGVRVSVEPITSEEICHYVVMQPEFVRARAALVEAYRLLTDFVTPMCVLRQIAPAVDVLEKWVGQGEGHCASH